MAVERTVDRDDLAAPAHRDRRLDRDVDRLGARRREDDPGAVVAGRGGEALRRAPPSNRRPDGGCRRRSRRRRARRAVAARISGLRCPRLKTPPLQWQLKKRRPSYAVPEERALAPSRARCRCRAPRTPRPCRGTGGRRTLPSSPPDRGTAAWRDERNGRPAVPARTLTGCPTRILRRASQGSGRRSSPRCRRSQIAPARSTSVRVSPTPTGRRSSGRRRSTRSSTGRTSTRRGSASRSCGSRSPRTSAGSTTSTTTPTTRSS